MRWALTGGWLLALAVAVVAVRAEPVRAEQAAAGDNQGGIKVEPALHPSPEEEHAKPDILSLKRWDLGLWTLVLFAALLFVLTRFAWKPMLEGLRKREDAIRGAIDSAQKTKAEAESLHVQLQQKMAQVNDEIRRMLDEARRDAQQARERMLADARTAAQQERDRTLREIDTARDQALQDLYKQAVELATLLSAKTIRRELTADDHRRLVDEALSELQRTAAGNGEGAGSLAGVRT
jgi:F-type H+-transporting ATPase subunit b